VPDSRCVGRQRVLGEYEDYATVDSSVASDESVAGNVLRFHAEVGCAGGDELSGFLECAFVEEEVDALAGGEFAGLFFAGAAFGAAAGFGLGVALGEVV
jgi:hypothetical protein